MNQQIRDCLPPDRDPTRPSWSMPAGAIDTHVHVFEDRYPLSAARGYKPPKSTLDHLRHLHATLGLERVVFIQPSIYGIDISDDELLALDSRGARWVRLNTDNLGGLPITMHEIPTRCNRIRDLGWHIEFLFPGAHIIELLPTFAALTVPMTIGHFAYHPRSTKPRPTRSCGEPTGPIRTSTR